ncbi:MAG: PPC domain-containing protein [Deltaproteobacteria bacterium]|nr:PPC domain-containing protein [Deltaproteobacteria bacterium]
MRRMRQGTNYWSLLFVLVAAFGLAGCGDDESNPTCDPACDADLCMVCTDGSCVSSCTAGQTCDNGTCVTDTTCDPACDASLCMVCTDGTCVTSCTADQICDNGTCITETTCTDGETRCEGNVVQTCAANTWTVTTDCTTSGQTCQVDNGVAQCQGGVTCDDGATRCEANWVETCANNTWGQTTDCGLDTCVIDTGVAVCQAPIACDPVCDATLCMECDTDVGECVSSCAAGEICDNGTCIEEPVCDPACDADACMICDNGSCVSECVLGEICDGSGNCVADTSCDPACDADACMVCEDGSCVSTCVAGQICDGAGSCIEEVLCDPACDATTCMVCDNGTCVSECDPAACMECVDGACESTCTGNEVCDAGTCVECIIDEDCPGVLNFCVNSVCEITCGADSYEDNDTSDTAAAITLDFDDVALTICDNEDDWFSFDLVEEHGYVFHLAFEDASGDIDVRLYAAGNTSNSLAGGGSGSDDEHFTYIVPAGEGGSHLLLVYLYNNNIASQQYDLSITDLGVPECTDDEGCNAGEICEEFSCITGCRVDDQCAEGEVCADQLCIAGCRIDSECAAGEICEDLQCITGCHDDNQCAAGEICEDLQCMEGCRNNGDCPQDEICDADHACVVPDCMSLHDCTAGQICEDYLCVDYACDGTNSCPTGLVCDNGACVECLTLDDCPNIEDFTCVDNVCVNSCVDDSYYPNSVYLNAAVINTLPFENNTLTLCEVKDEDWFSLNLEANHAYALTTNFIHADGDVDLFLYHESNLAVSVARSSGTSSPEEILFPTPSDGAGMYYVKVLLYSNYNQSYELLISDTGAIDCIGDGDCNTAEICEDFFCIDGCRSDNDCSTDEICEENFCITGCRSDNDCATGDLCIDDLCVTPECMLDSDCGTGEVCRESLCITPPIGDACFDPIVVGSLPFTDANVDITTFGPDIEFADSSTSSCTGYATVGTDVVYEVLIPAGSELFASMTPSGDDLALYVTSDCSVQPMPDETCLGGDDSGFTNGTEEVTVAADTMDRTVYVVVDDYSSNPSTGTYELTIVLQ